MYRYVYVHVYVCVCVCMCMCMCMYVYVHVYVCMLVFLIDIIDNIHYSKVRFFTDDIIPYKKYHP